jgi:hypothetical protein
MFRPIYRTLAALALSAVMAVTVVAVDGSHHAAPVADGHWCC